AAGCDQVITVTFTAVDSCGNTGTATATFTVDDEVAPIINCPATPQIRIIGSAETNYTAVGTEFDYTNLSDNCGTPTATHNLIHPSSTTLDGYIFGLGDTEVIWTALDECGNSSSCSFTVSVHSPNIEIEKTVDFTEISAPTLLTYTITVTNTGNVSLTNVVLTDDLAGTATLTSGDDGNGILEVGEAWVYTATYAATQVDIDAGDALINTASVVTTEITTPVTDDATTTITATPAMTVVKVVDLTSISAPATLTYTITVTNTGNVSLTGVVLSDDLAGAATLTSGDDGDGILEVGEAWVYTATYAATQDDIDAGDALINTASVVTAEITTPVTDDATTTITATPAMTVVKVVDQASISAPATLTYTITVTNTGNVSLTNVVLTDDLAGAATLTSGDDGDGILEVGETWIYSATYVATQANIDAGTALVNTASVRVNQITDPVTDDAVTTITATPAMTVEKVVDIANISTPATLTYTITVTNTGNVSLTNVVLTDDIAGAATLTSGDDGDGILEVGEAWVYTATYEATKDDIDAGDALINTASVVTTEITTPVTDDATTTITATPAMTVEKVVDIANISAPATLTYTITVTNTGNVSLTGVVLTDDLAGTATLTSGDDGDGILEVGEAWVYTATYAATQDDIDDGDALVNTASVVTAEITTPVTDDATTTITATPAMTVVKVVDLPVISAPATLTYTITVTNTGNVSLTNVVLSDDLAGIAILTSGDDGDGILEVGEAWVYTATYAATQDDIDDGDALVNTASVVTTEITTPVTDDATTTITATPAMTVQKVVDLPVISAPATLRYTITVTNTGNVSLTNVVLTDDLAGTATLTSGDDGDGILEVGEAWVYTATYAATQDDIDDGDALVNTASVVTTEITTPVTDDATTTITATPAMTVVKTVDLPVISAPATLTYTITVTNTGNVSLTTVVLTDDLAGTATLTSGDDGDGILEVGEAWVYTATYAATQDDIDAGDDLINTASVVTTEITTPVTDDATTTITRNTAMTVVKVVDLPVISAPATLTYTITVTNTGNVSLTNVVLTDDLAGTATLTSGDDGDGILEVGEAWVYTATYAATQDDIDDGDALVNTASVVTTEITTPVTDDATTTITSTPAMTVVKTVDLPVISAPATLTYTITVTNTGNVSLTTVVLTDDLAGTATLTSGDDGDGILEVGEAWVYTATYAATQAHIDAGADLVNTAAVTTTQIPVAVTDDATTTIAANPAMTVEKVVNLTEISAPATLTYTITVTNTGNVSLTNVVLTDDLAGTATRTSGDDGDNILEVGEAWIYSATYVATQANIDAGTALVNTASVRVTQITDPVTDNAVTTITATPAMTVEKVVDITNISTPTTLTYTITVTNTGNVTLANVVLSDDLAGTATRLSGDTDNDNVLDVGEAWVYTATYAATQSDIDAGTALVNTASVRVNQITEPVTDDATTTITATPAMTVEKVVDIANISAPTTLNYTITVTNTGNVSLTAVVVADNLAGAATRISGDTDNDNVLDVGEVWTYTATYAAIQADIDAGTPLINTASVTATQIPVAVTDNAITTVTQISTLTIAKTVNLATVSEPITLNYSIVAENTGNTSLTGVVLTDVLTGGATLISGDTNSNNILDVGETWTYAATYAVTQSDIDAGAALVNRAEINTNQTDLQWAEATTTISQLAAWSMTKVATEENYDAAGDILHYTITINNDGNVSIGSITVTDPGADAGSIRRTGGDTDNDNRLDPDETWIYTATHRVTLADIDAGHFTNTATATGTTVASGTITTTATADVIGLQKPQLTLAKAADRTEYTAPGEVINYTLRVTNTGNVTVTGITMADPNATVTCTGAPYTLIPGASANCTATHTVTMADIMSGTVVNTAESTGFSPTASLVDTTSNTVTVRLLNLPPVINCPAPILAPTSETSCDILISTGLTATYSDPNSNIATVTWTMTGATTDSSPATGINDLTNHTFSLGVTTVTYTVTDALGLSDNCSFTVTIEDNTPPIAICEDIEIFLDLATGRATITPEDIDGGSTDNCRIATLSASRTDFDCTDLGANSVILTVTDGAGNTSTCTANVTVRYTVDPNPIVTPDNDVICNGETINLALTSQIPSTTWTWTVNTPAGITGASDDNSGQLTTISQTIFNSADVARQLIYNITPRVYGACDLEHITANVWVNPVPEIDVSSADTILCYGDATVINVRNMNPQVEGQWVYDLQVTAEPGVTGFTTGGRYTMPTDLTETLYNTSSEDRQVIYSFTPRIVPADGGQECEGETETVTLIVHPLITYDEALSNYNGFNISCFGLADGSIRLTPTVDLAPFTYSWRGPNGYSTSNNTGYISGLRAGDYFVTITDRFGCHVADTFNLTEPGKLSMILVPSLSNDGEWNINCYGAQTGSIEITPVNGVGFVAYIWQDGLSFENPRRNLGEGTYAITIIDANNCRADTTQTLTDPPQLELAFDVAHAYCPDMPDAEIRLTVTGGSNRPEHLFQWSNGATTQDLEGIVTGQYSVTVTDYNECTVTGSALVRPKNEICLIIPEAFSPNGDGINDTWDIEFYNDNIDLRTLYPNIEIKIFNRWGQKLWESPPGYPEPWDGRSNGVKLPIDSYHYTIDLGNGSQMLIGTITIVYSSR
ncbi:MAG: gliding motility-associated C-terminal domain-containing protein, partial [Bacteroidales bacterium]